MDRDQELGEAVRRALEQEPGLDARSLTVSVCEGVVRLDGRLRTPEEKQAAERAVHRIPFVRGLRDAVQLALAPVPTDPDIAAAARKAAAGSVVSARDHVEVVVERGEVTLTGELTVSAHRNDVERNVLLIPGVTGVINRIRVPERQSPDVRSRTAGWWWPI
jgi:osmotically-inducible protein OsmY